MQIQPLLFGGIQALVVTGGAVPILDCTDCFRGVAVGIVAAAAAASVTADAVTGAVVVVVRVGGILLFGAVEPDTFGTRTSGN